jgi:putative lipase involved disintegration of autophagic bodies
MPVGIITSIYFFTRITGEIIMLKFATHTCKTIAITISLLLTACASSAITSYKDITPIEVTENIAGKYALYAMMSSNSYHNQDRVYFPLEKIDWQLVTASGEKTSSPTAEHPLTGLAYDIYQNVNSNDIVFAFRGTDSKWDYPMSSLAIYSVAYKQAVKAVREYREKHPEKKIVVTGHSLGGGLALSVSVRLGIDAITFDPSPRIFDGLGDKHQPAARILIYQEGEVLNKLRRIWKKISEVIREGDVYKTKYDFDGKSNHRGDLLAKGLLEQGKTSNPTLQVIYDSL